MNTKNPIFYVPYFYIPEQTKEQTTLLKHFFDLYDTDHNGILSAIEIIEVLKSSHIPTYHARLIVKFADINDNGAIGFPEFLESLKTMAQTRSEPQKTCIKLFERLDTDHDGSLDENKVFDFFNYVNPGKATYEQAKNFVYRHDSNKDGKLTVDEIIRAIQFH